jgi:hypothetical protein
MHLPPGDAVYEILEQAVSGCERAASLATQLLTFGKGGAPVRRTVSVAPLVGEGKARKQRDNGHDEPGFVAVPGWRDRVDHMIPRGFVRLQ